MNIWTKLSIEYANQRSYLDDLFSVYPTIPEGIRDVDDELWAKIESSFASKDNMSLIKNLLELELFPIKDSYVAYLRRDISAIERNPQTINRLSGRLYEMGLNEIYNRCSKPKETNRQIGPMFGNWLKRGCLGVVPVSFDEFMSNDDNAILDGSDSMMKEFAKEHLGYSHNKGLDFVARFNKKYVIGEAKFLTDFGGHQNAQLNDAINLLETDVDAVKVAILDGVLFIEGNNKMHNLITNTDYNIISALVLREFLYQI